MRFYSLDPTKETDVQIDMKADYSAGREIGVIRLGASHLYFRRIRKIYYIAYADIRRCFRRVMLVPAKLCCGKGDFEVENIVICTDKGEAAQIQMPGARAGKILLEEIKKLLPNAAFTPENTKSE